LLEERDSLNYNEIAGHTRLPDAYLKRILDQLDQDGYIAVDQGFSVVRIARTDKPRPVADGGQPVGVPSVDLAAQDIFTALCNDRRRHAIRLLAYVGVGGDEDADDIDDGENLAYVEVTDLADMLLRVEHGLRVGESLDSDARTSVYVTLTQSHLPLLDTMGVLEYHERPKKVGVGETVRSLAALLRTIDRASKRHPDRLYRGADSETGDD
jgi:hypothetical protein